MTEVGLGLKREEGRGERGEAGFNHKELISYNRRLIYEKKGSKEEKRQGYGQNLNP